MPLPVLYRPIQLNPLPLIRFFVILPALALHIFSLNSRTTTILVTITAAISYNKYLVELMIHQTLSSQTYDVNGDLDNNLHHHCSIPALLHLQRNNFRPPASTGITIRTGFIFYNTSTDFCSCDGSFATSL